MAKDPRAGELTTPNLGLTKPTVGASIDQWGGYINGDLDLIDTAVHNVQTSVPAASTTTPAMDGTAAVGTGTTWARADHVHPTDVHAIGDNRIINGDMRIDQRNGGASGTAVNAYTVDRWYYTATQASKGSWGRNGPPGISGFPYYLVFTSTSAYAPLAGDAFLFSQTIEADMVSDFAFGTANAQPVTLSFWAASTVSAAFGGALTNYASGGVTRSYPFTYTLAANTWTKVVVTIPGDTGGTWTMSGNLGGAVVRFDLGSGTTFRAAAGAWTNGNFVGVTGAANLVSVNGASFQITGVKLEIGSVATPYNRQSLAKIMADCQRYYQVLGSTTTVLAGGYQLTGGVFYGQMAFNVAMRATPTVTFSTPIYGNASALAVNGQSPTASAFQATVTSVGAAWATAQVMLNAEL